MVGFKPSYGQLSRHGLVAYASSMDTIGIMARSVADTLLVYHSLVPEGEGSASDPASKQHKSQFLQSRQDMTHALVPHSSVSGGSRALPFVLRAATAANSTNRNSNIDMELTPLSLKTDSLKIITDMQRLLADRKGGAGGGGVMDCRGITIGVPHEFVFEELDDRIKQVYNTTLQHLVELGCEVKQVHLPSVKDALQCYYVLACAEASSNLSRYDGVRYGTGTALGGNVDYVVCDHGRRQDGQADALGGSAADMMAEISGVRGKYLGSVVKRRVLTGTYVLSHTAYQEFYATALLARARITSECRHAFRGVDVLLGPTSPTLPFRMAHPPGFGPMMLNDIYTILPNLTQCPAISIPVDVLRPVRASEPPHMPIGVQLIGDMHEEGKLFRIALALEGKVSFQDIASHTSSYLK